MYPNLKIIIKGKFEKFRLKINFKIGIMIIN